MWSSRRSSLAQPADRPRPPGAAPGSATRLSALALLVLGGVAALLLAVRLCAAAFGRDFSPFAHLAIWRGPAENAWLLAAAMIVLVLLVWLVLRHGDEMLWLGGESGGVLVPAAALERLAEASACRHPEVVRADACLRVRDGVPLGTLRVYGRPLADSARLGVEVENRVCREIFAVIGRRMTKLDVRTQVLAVGQLKRRLP
jgi:hypothetical protein